MNGHNSTYLQELLNKNQLEEAQSFCESWVKREPHSDLAFNSLGLVYAKLGHMTNAVAAFEQSIQENANIAAYHNNLGNAYFALGQIEKAKQHLYQALSLDPQHAESYNNLGRLLYKQGLYADAIHYLQKAIRLQPDYWEAHYNLAHSYVKQNQFQDATTHYQEVLRILPSHANAHVNLGLLYFEQENYAAAKDHLQKAFELSPKDVTAIHYLGNSYLSLGEVKPAIEAFEKTLQLSPLLMEVHHNLAILYLKEDRKEKALFHFEKAFELDHSDDTAQHMIMALRGMQSEKAPKHYVSALFDQYADYYDKHMKEKLHYAVPGLLRAAVGKCLTSNARAGRVLDMGCGTGLCGIYFRDLALELVGVDISPQMVAKATLLGAYDSVITADLLEYLSKTPQESFDLIIAGDVLVYMGDLNPVFKAVYAALVNHSFFAFTTEHVPQGEYVLKPSGRFGHARAYIENLAKKYKFTIVSAEAITPREHEGKAIEGDLYVLRKEN